MPQSVRRESKSTAQNATLAGASQTEEEPQSSYKQQMPDEQTLNFEAQLMPVHLQYNFLNRDQMPLHNQKNSRDMDANLCESIHQQALTVPSHVVLNHANFHSYAADQPKNTDCGDMASVAVT
jgi:hypothetical protein